MLDRNQLNQFERRLAERSRRNDDAANQDGGESLRYPLLVAGNGGVVSGADDCIRNAIFSRRVLRTFRRTFELESVAGGGNSVGRLRRELPDGTDRQRHVLLDW